MPIRSDALDTYLYFFAWGIGLEQNCSSIYCSAAFIAYVGEDGGLNV